MQDQPTTTLAGLRYEVIAGRFQLLAIGPTATRAEVGQAFTAARERAAAPEQALTEARDKILDPAQRLASELAYPLDGSAEQASTFYADLSGDAPEFSPSASKLPPLSRANFLALLAARHAADADMLVALVDAHAAIDAAAIFDILKDCRSRAAFPTPSLVDVRQGLQELLTLHCEGVIATYDPIQSAAGPLLECARKITSSNDRYRLEALSGLMDMYRRSLASMSHTSHDLDAAFTAIGERADDSSVNQFGGSLNDWLSPIAPLALFDSHQKLRNTEIDKIIARTRVVLADLIATGDHKTARKITTACLDAFSLLPGFIEPFEEVAKALQELELEAAIKPLADLIQNFDREPAPLVADIQRKGFGIGSTGQARALWDAFSAAVTATSQTALHERPWMSVRDLVFQLDTRPESAKAATRMMADLLRSGETLAATPTILEILRDDLSELEARNGPATVSGSRAASYMKMALFITLVPVSMFAAFLTYRYLNVPAPLVASAPQSVPTLEPVAIPPASKGERFKLDFVRYCHFQEERLRVIKLHVRGPEDIQAFNMLANDYNSRCSNFYYQDEDLKVVTEEVQAKKQMLEADAMRILSTWPWHAASDSAKSSGR